MLFNQTVDYWKSIKGIHTAQEIHQQPKTWSKTFDIVRGQYDAIQAFIATVTSQSDYKVIFAGAGTSEFVGRTVAPLLQKDGNSHFASIATTELVATPHLYVRADQPTLIVSFGRSGNSPESIGAIDVVNVINPNIKHLVITCNGEGELAQRSGSQYYSIILPPETNDVSFAMTSSYTNMVLTAYLCFSPVGLDKAYAELNSAIVAASSVLEDGYAKVSELVKHYQFSRIVYLGDGSLNGVAQESALKMLELSAGEVVTMFNSPLGFRHGPKSIINKETLTVVYLSADDYTRQYQFDIIKEISTQRDGNKILAVDCMNDKLVADLVDVYITVDVDAQADALLGIVYVIVAQLFALVRSASLNKSPDNPWPSGMVNRVVKGVEIYPYSKKGD